MTRLAPSALGVLVCVLVGIGAGLALGAGQGKWLLAGFAALIFAVATWKRPELAVGALIIVLPLYGDRAIVSVPALPDVTIGRSLIGWAIIVVGHAFLQQRQRSAATPAAQVEQSRKMNSIALWIFVFIALMALAAVRNPSLPAGVQGWLDSYILPLCLLVVLTHYRWSSREIEVVVLTCLLACCLWSVLALIESQLGYSFFSADSTLKWASRSDALARTGGPFINPAFLGTATGIGLMLAWVWARRPSRIKRVAVATLPIGLIGLAVTQTRASWLGAAAGILVVLILMERRRVKAVAIGALGITVVIVTLVLLLGASQFTNRATSTSEIFNRIIVQRAAVNLIAEHPLLGVGSGWFATLSRGDLRNVGDISGTFGVSTLVPHNTVLSAAVDGGLGAAVSLVVVFGLLVAAAFRLTAVPARRHLGVAALGAITVFVVNAMFIDIFLGIAMVTLSLTVIGVLLSPQPDNGTTHEDLPGS